MRRVPWAQHMTQPHDPQDNVYTFGDSERAAERLYWLARVFEPSSLSFAAERCPHHTERVLDLGAGPGFGSAGLHAALTPRETVGLEASASFIAYGSPHLPAHVRLVPHDVTTPLPLPGDVLFSRFLLTHLRDPRGALAVWHASAPKGATLACEELVSMRSPLATLSTYYALVARVQAAAGHDMHVGTRLGELVSEAGFGDVRAEVVTLPLPVRHMARLHALNLPTLRLQPVAQATYGTAELDALQAALEALVEHGEGHVEVRMARASARVA